MLRYTNTILFNLLFFLSSYSQIPHEDKMMARITKEIWVGGTIHTSGFALDYGKSKFLTFKKKSLFTVSLITNKHDKEYKIFGSFDENAKKFVFGKVNSLFALRFGFGRRKVLYNKLRDNGLQISMNYTFGPSLGFVKPVFLEVFKYDVTGRISGVSLERYNPESHNLTNIYGRGPWSSGFGSSKLNPGLFFKLGLEFEYSYNREIMNSLEIGFSVDGFLNKVLLMAENEDHRFYPNLYLSCSFGNKFY